MEAPRALDWKGEVTRCIASVARPVHFMGVGNRMRSDDGAGLEAVATLRRFLGKGAPSWVTIHADGGDDRAFSRVPVKEGIVLFDAVESQSAPGTIICTTLADTRYGFFATHNIPLRLLPGLAERADDVIVIGIEPESLEVGEGLSKVVRESVDLLARELADQLRSNT